LTGVVIGGALPILVLHGCVQPWYTMRVLDIDLRTYLTRSVLPPLAAAIPYGVALALLAYLFPPESLVTLGVIVAASLPVFGVAALFLCFGADERRALTASLQRRPAPQAAVETSGS
jgi:hypothetical protein